MRKTQVDSFEERLTVSKHRNLPLGPAAKQWKNAGQSSYPVVDTASSEFVMFHPHLPGYSVG
ncbi:unnamed protein product, partial [Dicrocoelium dendriticum]